MEQVLPTDERDTYEACLVAVNTDITSLPCVITGSIVTRNLVANESNSFFTFHFPLRMTN